jgi:hypothetical protein
VGVFRRRPITETESNSSVIIGRLQLPLAGFTRVTHELLYAVMRRVA